MPRPFSQGNHVIGLPCLHRKRQADEQAIPAHLGLRLLPQIGHCSGRKKSENHIEISQINLRIVATQKSHPAMPDPGSCATDEPGRRGDFGAEKAGLREARLQIKRHIAEAAPDVDETKLELAVTTTG